MMKINGRFSYDRTSQRDLPFYTEIRELDLGSRVFVGDESKAVLVVGGLWLMLFAGQGTTACTGWRSC